MVAVEQSVWHVNDVVAYDLMREVSVSVQARLVERVRQGDESARMELLDVRRATNAVDGYDRAAVDMYAQQLQVRDAELALGASRVD
jgi:hypothetical protein